jgi:hypothetical protein
VKGGPAAAQLLGWLAGVGIKEPVQLLGGQGADRQAGALVDGRAELVEVLLVLVGVGVLVLAHVLLPSASLLAAVAFLAAVIAGM